MTTSRYEILISQYSLGTIAYRDYMDLRREWKRQGVLGPSLRDQELDRMAD